MLTANIGDIQAVAFDIDGTLYKPLDLHARMMFHFFRFNQFFLQYGIVRSKIHDMGVLDDFYAAQAEMLAKRIGCSVDAAKERLERIVYKGLSSLFESIPLCAHVEETFQAFHAAGLKIALMSDFPPEQKGGLWGLKKYCDVATSFSRACRKTGRGAGAYFICRKQRQIRCRRSEKCRHENGTFRTALAESFRYVLSKSRYFFLRLSSIAENCVTIEDVI